MTGVYNARMSAEIRVRIVTFGSAVAVLGFEDTVETMPAGSRVCDLVEKFEREHPRLIEARGRIRFAVNREYAKLDTPLNDGDELALIPPVSGGESDPTPIRTARLIRRPIDFAQLVAESAAAQNGAIATFLGVVRAEQLDGKTLRQLEYTAHEEMARAEMQRLVAATAATHDISTVIVEHRLGTLVLGDASIAIVVSSPHRAAALNACRELIDRIKESVPIFKREIWDDGKMTWVNPL
jgi:molybdopterin synthase catalytic subunit